MKRVVKLGGRAQSADALASLVAEAWRTCGALCVVHGGGDEISKLQRTLGGEPKFAGGRRVTTAEDLDVIRMVLSGVVNKRLVSQFGAAGAPAVGVSGEDASLIAAQALGIGEFGYVGMPSRINTSLIESLWLAGFLPVVSPLASNADEPGSALNVNGDDAAAALAVALAADELLLVADVDGVLDETGALIPQLDVDEARALIASGVAAGGMAAKLEAAHAALAGGVRTVRIADLGALANAERGTFITLATVAAK
ncbi:MAG TPA: acetylglutamate kinase [Candidatus Elarobacter sp.]|nr:acetylglutamate kinase [Candidatus Elarobacter sp.]